MSTHHTTIQQIKNIYHFVCAIIACIWYGFPGKQLPVIGITGTDGKTTTTSLIVQILQHAGKKVSYVTTVGADIAGVNHDTGFHTTTPSAFAIQRYLAESLRAHDDFFVLETTSHALDQYRVFGIDFIVSGITNITHEHLHYHVTYDRYVQAKARILAYAKQGFINSDDQSYSPLKKLISPLQKVQSYGYENNPDISVDIEHLMGTTLPRFNKYNYLLAYIICRHLGIEEQKIVDAMKTFVPPEGRLDVVYSGDFSVIVDFAHTPNALHEALPAIRSSLKDGGRLIHIFGAAAFRDDAKRPLMGRESGKHADLTIITEEDYRTEDPNQIAKHIATGLELEGFSFCDVPEFGSKSKQYTIIHDRMQAIRKALSIARKGDIIVLTGKGHERSLCRGKVEYPWNDGDAVRELISQNPQFHNNS